MVANIMALINFNVKDKRKFPESYRDLHKQLRKIDEKYSNINAGGCGIFALALKKRLEKAGFDVDLFTFSIDRNFSDKIQNCNNSLAEANARGISLGHIMCRIGNTFIDSTGVYLSVKNTIWDIKGFYHERISEASFVKSWLKEKECWNPLFDTEQLPHILKDIKNLKLKNLKTKKRQNVKRSISSTCRSIFNHFRSS